MSKQRFKDLNCNDETVEQFDNLWVISIYGSAEESPFFKSEHYNVLCLQVDDILDPDVENNNLILFNEEHAEKVCEFINNLKSREEFTLVIHCHAGICRSGAIAEFARNILRLSLEDFNRENQHILPNCHISKVLREYYNQVA